MVEFQNLYLPSEVVFSLGTPKTGSFILTTDSLQAKGAEVFLALKGIRFDGFDFASAVLGRGCPIFIYQHTEQREELVKKLFARHPHTFFIGVADSVKYFQQVAHQRLASWKKLPGKKVITVTGSNGKTTFKEMLAYFCQTLLGINKVCSTMGNLNNHLGLPMTIMQLNDEHDLLVLEIGTNHPGEIKNLCQIIEPNYGYITNIGDSHLEFFGDRAGVFQEKSSLFLAVAASAAKDRFFLVNGDDPFLCRFSLENFCCRLGHGPTNDYQITTHFNQLEMSGKWVPQGQVVISNPYLIGKHNFFNLAAALVMTNELYGQIEKLLGVAATFRPPNNRSKLTGNLPEGFMFLDAYNANPSSMEKSISGFCEFLNAQGIPLDDALFVLGDMNELGEYSAFYHQRLGAWMQEQGINNVIFVGRFANFFASGHKGKVKLFTSLDQLAPQWPSLRAAQKHLLLKASRSLQLESIAGIK